MSYLGIKEIDPDPGGREAWSFDHATHHQLVTETLNRPVQFTGDLFIGSAAISNLSSTQGLFVGMGIAATGLPGGALITAVDSVTLAISVNVRATATVLAAGLTAAFPLIPFYVLDPISADDPRQFLLDHQNSHNAINSALGTVGNDLQDVEFRDREQLAAWVNLNFTEHEQWSTALGVS